MARKGIFGNSLRNAMDGKFDAPVDDGAERRSSPNIARAEASLKESDRRATRMVSPGLIQASRFSDRIDATEDLAELIESIREHGQQVPVLLRRLETGDLEVVYGRRRVLACKALGIDVRASVLEMSEEEALIAQGIENNQRLNTSFIEKALFIVRILDAGFSGVVVHRATGVNDTLIYKMRAIVAALPEALIQRIGPAHGAGRRQWEALSAGCKAMTPEDLGALTAAVADLSDLASTERLTRAIALARQPRPAASADATDRISVALSGSRLTLTTHTRGDADFLKHLEALLPDLLAAWDAAKT